MLLRKLSIRKFLSKDNYTKYKERTKLFCRSQNIQNSLILDVDSLLLSSRKVLTSFYVRVFKIHADSSKHFNLQPKSVSVYLYFSKELYRYLAYELGIPREFYYEGTIVMSRKKLNFLAEKKGLKIISLKKYPQKRVYIKNDGTSNREQTTQDTRRKKNPQRARFTSRSRGISNSSGNHQL